MQQQESRQAKKRWDVAEVPVKLEPGCTWGVPAWHVPVILEKLLELGLIEKTDVVPGKLKLGQFRILIAHLHQNGYKTDELPAALDQWLNEGKEEEPAAKNALDVEIQQVLSTLTSPQLKEPFTLIADGFWGPASNQALEFINNTYNIVPLERDNELLNVLISISQRVVRISCTDEWINSRLVYNPFCLVNNEYDEMALRSKDKGVSLFEKAAEREMVHFHSAVAARNKFINTPFARFSAWYMLLRMPTMNYQQVCRLSIRNAEGEWMPVEQLNKPASDTSFFVQPDVTMSFADFKASIPVAFHSPTEEAIDIIAVFYSGNLQVAITSGYSIDDKNVKGIVRLLDSEQHFKDHKYLDSGEVRFFQKADYCRIFVVKKDFKPYNRQEKYNEFPGTDLPPDYYKLITANAADIYTCVTIGLLLNENKKNIEFDQQPKGVLFEQFKSTVEELYSRKKVLVEDDLQKHRWGGNARENGKRLYGKVRKSKVPGLYNVILSVSSTDKTEFKGLVAFFLHNSFKNEIQYATAIKGVAKIEITAYEAFTAAAYTEDGTMLELDLNEIPRLAKGFYYNSVSDKFKEAAERLGNSKPITVKGDPQKNRWGGLSVNNGKQVSATVKSSIMPGYFNVCIEVSSTDTENPFMGDVAFFLHPTFRNRIKYRKSTDGKAKLNLTAYEAFTIGAYLHDGTMLELDLQQVKGYPEGFYYHE